MLPDVCLLEIFDFYVSQAQEEDDDEGWPKVQAWHTLVHVCRKWRTVVLGSPRRLDLRLFCTDTTPVKETLAAWPPLPIVIGQYGPQTQTDNIIMALKHIDRICQIKLLDVTNSQLEEVLPAMQQPFLVLTDLAILLDDQWEWENETPPVVSESFLGGSAPCLQCLQFEHIPFPGLPKLLLAATGLISLCISQVPHSGYISPEAIVGCLSTLTRLEELKIGFESPLSRPVRDTRHPHPLTRSALPSLTYFRFKGVSEYLEDLVARIDAPLLDSLHITFFHRLIFDTPQLAQFIARTPNIRPPIEARINFSDHVVEVASPRTYPRNLELGVSCRQSDWQLSSLIEVCSSSFPEAFIRTVEHLYICEEFSEPHSQDDIEDSQWLEILRPFTAAKYLYVDRGFVSGIAPALQELTGEVLPSLQNLFLRDLHVPGSVQGAIEQFVTARQHASHPVAVSHWDRKQDEWY